MRKFKLQTKWSIMCLLLLALPITSQAQTYKQYTNLPTVYVEVDDGSTLTSKKDFKDATFIYVCGDSISETDGLKIRCRGNSTFSVSQDKKAYRLKFSNKIALLGEGHVKAKNWVLMANAFDKTMMRNALTSDIMANFMGMPFCPGSKFVDLVINSKYMGTYQITDHPDPNAGRLPLNLDETSGTDIDYFLESDGWEDHNTFKTTLKNVPVRIHNPKDGEITTAQTNYVKSYINNFENVLFGTDFKDPEEGYRTYVDSISLANLYIATEMSANIDGFWSTYLYKKKSDNKLYFGPLWDYDIAYGNDTRKGDTSEMLIAEDGYGVARLWIAKMWKDPWFRNLIYQRWTELREMGLKERLLNAVDSMADVLTQSQELNYNVWGISNKIYHERFLYDNYSSYVNDLKEFIEKRTNYLDKTFKEKVEEDESSYNDEFQLISNYYYRIVNYGNDNNFDTKDQGISAGTEICLWDEVSTRKTQQWTIRKLSNGYYQFINRASNLALNDPTEGESTATTNTGTTLNIVEPDTLNDSQLWQIVVVDGTDRFNIINKHTQHGANCNGGSSDNGTAVISYTNDAKNSTSKNRQWYIVADEVNSDSILHTGDEDIPTDDEIYGYEGNYRLIWTDDAGVININDTSYDGNDDNPWGFYSYTIEDGIYSKFTLHEGSSSTKAKSRAWCNSTSEYLFVSDKAQMHALTTASPAVVFTAPADGVYYIDASCYRTSPSSSVKNPHYARSRFIPSDSAMSCPVSSYVFAEEYGNYDTDGKKGKAPIDINFYVNMKQGDRITIEIECYTSGSNSSGRTQFTKLGIRNKNDKNEEYTIVDAKKSGLVFYNPYTSEEPEGFMPEKKYYGIICYGNDNHFDLDDQSTEVGTGVCLWEEIATRKTQEWIITRLDNGYYQIVNREANLALNDPTEGDATATTNTGTQLNVTEIDSDNDSQLWTLVEIEGTNRFNIINKRTQHGANCNGGSSKNGTAVISYTNDSKNTTSKNRQWYLVAGDEIVDTPEVIYETVEIGESGWTSFSSDNNLDFSKVEEITAYYVDLAVNGIANLVEESNPASSVGLLLNGLPGSYEIPVAYFGNTPENNLLVATNEGEIELMPTGEGNWVYVFGYKDADFSDVGFYTIYENHKIGKNHSYLKAEDDAIGNAGVNYILFHTDTATSILSIGCDEMKENSVYDLTGRKVSEPGRGIYIINKKSVLIK